MGIPVVAEANGEPLVQDRNSLSYFNNALLTEAQSALGAGFVALSQSADTASPFRMSKPINHCG